MRGARGAAARAALATLVPGTRLWIWGPRGRRGFENLLAFVRDAEIDMPIIALPLDAKARIRWLLDRFRALPVEVRLSAFSESYAFAGREDGLISAVARSFAPSGGRPSAPSTSSIVDGYSPATACRPASPDGRGSTAGAARTMTLQSCARVSTTASTTSRTGRPGST
jgi:hypothetical protein